MCRSAVNNKQHKTVLVNTTKHVISIKCLQATSVYTACNVYLRFRVPCLLWITPHNTVYNKNYMDVLSFLLCALTRAAVLVYIGKVYSESYNI